MGFVQWLIGVLATFAAIKFVWMIFRSITSKENMRMMMDKANDGLHDAAEDVSYWIKKKNTERKKKKKEKEAEAKRQPIVTIR